MKHIIIPLCGCDWDDFDYLAGMPAEEMSQVGMIRQGDRTTIDPPGGKGANGCWTAHLDIGQTDQVCDALTQLRSRIDPVGHEKFMVDVIVDAAHTQQATEFLRRLDRIRNHFSIHIVFLYAHRSEYAEPQSRFYTLLRGDISGLSEAGSGMCWNYLTLLPDENRNDITGEQICLQRDTLLPYLLRDSHNGAHDHECNAYAADMRRIRYDLIGEIPHVQAIRYTCEKLLRGNKDEANAVLLMAAGRTLNDAAEQRKTFKENLLRHAGQYLIRPEDLLIHKHDPEAVVSTRSLLEALLRDNPDRDARVYDETNGEALARLPQVRSAVEAWENDIVHYAREHANIDHLLDELQLDSEWAAKIDQNGELAGGYYPQNPLTFCTSVTNARQGYHQAAGDALDSEVAQINENLKEAIYQACLRLIRIRLHGVYVQVEQILRKRREAAEQALKALAPYEYTESLTGNWCETINGLLPKLAGAVEFRLSDGEPAQLIESYARTLSDQLKSKVNPEAGRREMAGKDNANRIVQDILNNSEPVPLINGGFTGDSISEAGREWFVNDLLNPDQALFGDQPVTRTRCDHVLRLTRYNIYPDNELAPRPGREGNYSDTLFQREQFVWDSTAAAQPEPEPAAEPLQTPGHPDVDSSMHFFWKYPEANSVVFSYRVAGEQEIITKIKKSDLEIGGDFRIPLPAELPSGAMIEVEIVFQRLGEEIGRLRPYTFENKTKVLPFETEQYETGVLFFKKSYTRLRVREGRGETIRGRVAVMNPVSGCICRQITWQPEGDDDISEPLPEFATWCLANNPDNPFTYVFTHC